MLWYWETFPVSKYLIVHLPCIWHDVDTETLRITFTALLKLEEIPLSQDVWMQLYIACVNITLPPFKCVLDCVWNVMAHAQKPYFVFRRNGRVHLNRQGRQFSRLLADEVCASAVVMLDTSCSEVVWRVLATQSVRQFPLHFPSRASPCHHISSGLYCTLLFVSILEIILIFVFCHLQSTNHLTALLISLELVAT